MRFLIMAASILLIASFSLTPIFAKTENENSAAAAKAKEPAQVERPSPKGAADANTVADANTLADANAAENEPELSEEVERSLKRLNTRSGREKRLWTYGRTLDRARLVRAVQTQVEAELNVIRQLAVEEGAVETTEVIDRILAARNERVEQIIERLESAEEQGRNTRRRSRPQRR